MWANTPHGDRPRCDGNVTRAQRHTQELSRGKRAHASPPPKHSGHDTRHTHIPQHVKITPYEGVHDQGAPRERGERTHVMGKRAHDIGGKMEKWLRHSWEWVEGTAKRRNGKNEVCTSWQAPDTGGEPPASRVSSGHAQAAAASATTTNHTVEVVADTVQRKQRYEHGKAPTPATTNTLTNTGSTTTAGTSG